MSDLIFLDIDGVLNDHSFDDLAKSCRIVPSNVVHLNRIIVETGAKIVLSSAWRYLLNRDEMTLQGLDWLLRSHGVAAGALVGITHPDTPIEWDEENGVPSKFMENERAKQVSRYRAKVKHKGAYVVIDDLDLGFTEAGHPFVQADSIQGLRRHDARKAIVILRGQK